MVKKKKKGLIFFLKKHIHSLLVISLCLFVFISHVVYVLATHQYPLWDEHVYLDLAVNYLDILKAHSPHFLSQIMDYNPGRQPLFGLAIALPLLLFGTAYTYKIALIVTGLFYITTIATVYFLAKEFVHKTAAFMAALLFACYGFPLFYLHFTYSETALTTFALLAMLFLKKSENFSLPRYALLAGLFFLFGNLTRWVAPIFFVGPLVYTCISGIIVQFDKKQRNIKQFLWGLSLFLLIGIVAPLLIYYLPSFTLFSTYIHSNTANASRWVTQFISPELTNPFSVRSVMYYINIFSQQTIFLFVLFVVGLIAGIIRFKKYGFLVIAFLFPYCFFTFITVLKDDRYIVPIYPIMAILSAIVFTLFRNRYAKGLLLITFTSIALMSFFAGSWGVGPMGFQGLKDIVLPSFIHHPRRIYLTPMVWPPRKEESNAHLFFAFIEKDWQRKDRLPVTLAAFSYGPINNAEYTIIKYEKRHLINSTTLVSIPRNDYESLFKAMQTADYIYLKDKNPIQENVRDLEEWYMIGQFIQAMKLPSAQLPGAFAKRFVYFVPIDNSQVIVYKKTRPITQEEFVDFAKLFVTLHPEQVDEIVAAAEASAK